MGSGPSFSLTTLSCPSSNKNIVFVLKCKVSKRKTHIEEEKFSFIFFSSSKKAL
jgi:hypothetical protein